MQQYMLLRMQRRLFLDSINLVNALSVVSDLRNHHNAEINDDSVSMNYYR